LKSAHDVAPPQAQDLTRLHVLKTEMDAQARRAFFPHMAQ